MLAGTITVRTLQALLLVWLATTPGPLAPGPGHTSPDRAAAAWAARERPGPASTSDPGIRIVGMDLAVPREEAVEETETEEDERDDLGRVRAGGPFGWGFDSTVPPVHVHAPWPTRLSARPRSLFLLCGRLSC